MVEGMLAAEQLSAILIILPFLAGVICYLIRVSAIRSIVILIAGAVLITSAVLLIPLTPFSLSPQPFWGVSIHVIVQALDFFLLLIILYFGFRHRHIAIKALALLQIIFLLYFEFFLIQDKQDTSTLYCDHLTLVMVLIVSIVGSLICFQAIAYMKNHEEHLRLNRSRQHQFFFVMMLFLSAMNGLVLSNDMLIFYDHTVLVSSYCP
jgi:ech hydrogenase subunit A